MGPRLTVLLLALLCGCHADLDWRELRSDEGGFSVWLPARPFEEARPLSGVHQGVRMRQWSARARDTAFAVGYADFDSLDDKTVIEIRDALIANVQGRLERERELSMPGVRAQQFVATGHAGATPLSLRLRLIAKDRRLYEIAVLGKPNNIAEGDLDTFFESFQLLKPQP